MFQKDQWYPILTQKIEKIFKTITNHNQLTDKQLTNYMSDLVGPFQTKAWGTQNQKNNIELFVRHLKAEWQTATDKVAC